MTPKQQKLIENYIRKVVRKNLNEASTPWGSSDTDYTIVRGVVWYSTPSHGGLKVAGKYLSDAAKEIGKFYAGSYWFEEDVAYAIPVYENFDTWGKNLGDYTGGTNPTKQELESTIKRWYPEYFDEEYKKTASANQSGKGNVKNLKEGDKVWLKGYEKYCPMTIGGKINNTSYKVYDKLGSGPYKLSKNAIIANLIKIEPS